jgi:hypothetical protein
MSYSETTSIVCATLVGVVLLVVIIVWVRQSIHRRRGAPVTENLETEEPAGANPVAPVVVPAAVPAAVEVPQPIQEPQVMTVEQVAVPEPNPDEALDDEPVTSQEIVSYLKELPTVEAEIAKDKFKGAAVEWTLFFSSMMLKGSNKIEVTLLNADNAYPGVSFLVDLDQYPEIGKIKWGMPVTVRGVISSVYSMYIVLTDVELSFPPSSQ